MVAKVSQFGKRRKKVFENVAVAVVFLAVCVLVIGFFAYQNVVIGKKRTELEGQLYSLQAHAGDLSLQKQELEGQIENKETAEYQEKILREQGLYKKPGEQVVTVLPAEEGAENVSGGEEGEERVWWKPWTWVRD